LSFHGMATLRGTRASAARNMIGVTARLNESAPPGQRLSSDGLVCFKVTLKLFEVGRIDMMVDCGLVRELLIEHELRSILRIKVQFVYEAAGLCARGSNERMQLGSELLFVPRSRLEVNVKNDWGFSHDFRNELTYSFVCNKLIYLRLLRCQDVFVRQFRNEL
jgi:hypothetical protein